MLSQTPGNLTARKDRSDEEAAALQGYFSQSASFRDLFLVLVIWPKLLHAACNKKFPKIRRVIHQ